MYDEKSLEIGRALFLVDVALTSLALLFSLALRDHFVQYGTVGFYSHMVLLPLVLALIMGCLSYFGAYKGLCSSSILELGWPVFKAIFFGVVALLALLYAFKLNYVSRLVLFYFSFIDFILLLFVRLIIKRYHANCIQNGKYFSRVLILGTGDRARELSEKLRQQSEWGITIIGHLDPDTNRIGAKVLDAPVIGSVGDIQKILKENVVDEVIIAIPRSMLTDAEHIAQACEEEGIKLRIMADLFDLEVARTKLIRLGKIPLLTLEPVALDENKLLVKRFLDLILSILILPLILPAMAIIALAIKFDSRGPVLFVQQRVGLKKRIFPMFKFRSMQVDADKLLKEIEHLNEAEGPIFKMKNDPRVTNVGKFLRKTSLDELPQLFNVLRGEMSLVGPRPMSIRDVDLFDQGVQRRRFSVKPGITCLWQISGRSELPFAKWLELDLNYIENWSIFLDIKILFKTIPAVLMSKGAV